MLYCEKCRSACPDSTAKCPNCKSGKLRAAAADDLVLLHRADQYTAQRLCELFDGAGIVYETAPFGRGMASYLYDSEVMPTDKSVYVRFSDMEAAGKLSAQLKETLERERQADGEFEEMPRRKRIVVQVLSMLAFFLLIVLAVFGADAFANWLKGLFGM